VVIPILMLAACGGSTGSSSSASQPPQAAACSIPPAATEPDVAMTLGPEQNHETFCLHLGKRVFVFLSVPLAQANTSQWAPIKTSDPTIVAVVPNGALTLVRGVTAATFEPKRRGVCHLSSTRPTGQAWTVTIVVE
jgi:hypothetical protein